MDTTIAIGSISLSNVNDAAVNITCGFTQGFSDVFNPINAGVGHITPLTDGWAKFDYTNSTSSTTRLEFELPKPDGLSLDQDYTFLYEVRNVTSSGGTDTFYQVQDNNSAFWGNPNNISNFSQVAGEKRIVRKVALNNNTLDKVTKLVVTNINVPAGKTVTLEMRVSCYVGVYSGPYIPYQGSKTGVKGESGKDGKDGVIESNGDNRILYGRGDSNKGFFSNATIATDWKGTPYGEFKHASWANKSTVASGNSLEEISTTKGLSLLTGYNTISSGKWTYTYDYYVTDSMAGGGYKVLRSFIRLHKSNGSYINWLVSNHAPEDQYGQPSNWCRRIIWNPEPGASAFNSNNPLVNPLENISSAPQLKVTAKCVPDELGNGITQYTVQHISSQEKQLFTNYSGWSMGTPSAWAAYKTVSGLSGSNNDVYILEIPKSNLKNVNMYYKIQIPISIDKVTAVDSSKSCTAEVCIGMTKTDGTSIYNGAIGSGFSLNRYTLTADGTANNYKNMTMELYISQTTYASIKDGTTIRFFIRLQNVASASIHTKDAWAYAYQKSGGIFCTGPSSVMLSSDTTTWSVLYKIRASKKMTMTSCGFERIGTSNINLTTRWQSVYKSGLATGQYGSFVMYGQDVWNLSVGDSYIIEIDEMKISNEAISKANMEKALLTMRWYRKTTTVELTEEDKVGLNGAVTGAISIGKPYNSFYNGSIRVRNVSLFNGDTVIPFAPAPEDIYDQNNSKVDQDQLTQIAKELQDQQNRLAQELAAKALASEVSELTNQLANLKERDLAGKADITKAVSELEKRLANVIPLGEISQKLQFIDSYILQGEEGMEIGNMNSGSKVMITPDRIGFFSGGVEVASFSSGQLRINNGFFADTITVGHFMTRKHPNNEYVNGTYFVK